MKKLWNVAVLTLAVNFVAVLAGAVWLHQTGRLDKDKALAIKAILFPPPPPPQETTLAIAPDPTTQPSLKLEELLAEHRGLPPGDQVEFMQRSFDAQMALLDRRHAEIVAMQQQVELARQTLAKDRAALDAERAALAAREEETARLASDEGFQDSLNLYTSMPSKQVKAVFLTLDDATVMRYLRAMEPRTAARIVKEFKTPDEVARIQQVLEMMRQAQASIAEDGS